MNRSAGSPGQGREATGLRPISRFIVMAILQAARARRLGLPEESAYSWGLNRAIFYAAAKRGFRGGGGDASGEGSEREPAEEHTYFLGDEKGYTTGAEGPLYFTIGGTTQTEKEFEKQIINRFGGRKNFLQAWQEAVEVVEQFGEATLRSKSGFFETVYRPRRDQLREAWTNRLTTQSLVQRG